MIPYAIVSILLLMLPWFVWYISPSEQEHRRLRKQRLDLRDALRRIPQPRKDFE